ncbi:unnamed protein product, partial [Lymnaea stagnalis]
VPSYSLSNWTEISNERIPGDLTYYTALCHIIAPVDQFDPGIYEVNVNIYPNVTGTDMDMEYGTISYLSISLDLPSVKLKLCPEIVVENSEVTCTCERSDTSLINASILWYRHNQSDDGGKGVISKGSLLMFKASRIKTVYYCKALNALNWTGPKLTALYSPKVIAKVHTIACYKNQSKDLLMATCLINKIYPEAECRFSIVFNEIYQIFTGYKISRNTMQIADDPIYYKTTCTLTISRRKLSHGIYDIDVTMYPNITGNNGDIKFGAKTKFSFNI